MHLQGPGSSAWRRLWPAGWVRQWLLTVTLAVYLLQLVTLPGFRLAWPVPAGGFPRQDGPFTEALVLDSAKVFEGQIWRLATYAFLHDPRDLLHLVLNMLYLWWFGGALEEAKGGRTVLVFYLGSAVFAGSMFCLGALLTGPGRTFGASGAVYALLVLCLLYFPAKDIWLLGLIPMPVWIFAVFSFSKDLVLLIQAARLHLTAGVAVSSHVGGAVAAAVYFFVEKARRARLDAPPLEAVDAAGGPPQGQPTSLQTPE